jgi:hypothetical protein
MAEDDTEAPGGRVVGPRVQASRAQHILPRPLMVLIAATHLPEPAGQAGDRRRPAERGPG